MSKGKSTTRPTTVGTMKRYPSSLRHDQIEALTELNRQTQIPIAALIRNGVDRELEARGVKVKGAHHGR